MAMKRCPADMHYYNPDKNPECPYCRNAQDEKISTGVFNRIANANSDERATTVPVIDLLKDRIAVPEGVSGDGDVVTKSIFKKKSGFNPVVGWLVCVEGSEKGRDYRIRPGINEVGRDDTADLSLSIRGDDMISRRDHAEIEYDPEENSYYLIRKKNQAVKLNDEKVRQPVRLKAYDIIQFGQTTLIFIPLCTEHFNWDKFK
ncbi:MAG: FHA domain-containing protein [Nitrospirae bacterium]|nr:FHA domain-containing protein [Nitrospirota bacterium]